MANNNRQSISTLITQYSKTNLELLKLKFLRSCRQKCVIPNGLRINFNLATGINDVPLVTNIHSIINECSSRILDQVISYTEEKQQSHYNSYSTIMEQNTIQLGRRNANAVVRDVKRSQSVKVNNKKRNLNNKLRLLIEEENNEAIQTSYGSRRINGSNYIIPTASVFIRKNRNHRKKQRRKKTVPDSFIPDENDIERLNPIVLAENVILDEVDKSVLRLGDKFCPTPTDPIDVHDQVVGTHKWAERIRWKVFFDNRQETQPPPPGFEDTTPEVDFVKKPWYQKTSVSAPKADQHTEEFIKACTEDFLNPHNRRKIKDNLTKEQRISIKKLKNLPLTHNAACRYADKTSNTVITSLENDDDLVMEELNNEYYYRTLDSDNTLDTQELVAAWAEKWKEEIGKDVVTYVTDTKQCTAGKVKPFTKTHKPNPWPIRLLLSGCGTPIQPLSKFVQQCTSHLMNFIRFQVIDTKEVLLRMERINQLLYPLQNTTRFVICDVNKLYPSVNNQMGVPAVEKLLNLHPGDGKYPTECIIEALQLCLTCNACKYVTGDGKVNYATPTRGTAMGPSHACDYCDIFMGELDELLIQRCPVPLLSSLLPPDENEADKEIDFCRFRDDGLALIQKDLDANQFTNTLQGLHPDITWDVQAPAEEVNYLDIHLMLKNGEIHSDIFSKSSHNYLPPNSCHPPSTFKGLIPSIGIRLRTICSHDEYLKPRIDEYAKYFATCGWDYNKAKKLIIKGANYREKDTEEEAMNKRKLFLNKPRKKKPLKVPWLSTYDPRLPSKSKILNRHMHILYRNPSNRTRFPEGMIISADRKRKSLANIIKPTVPKRFPNHGPFLPCGSFPCEGAKAPPCTVGACDLCKHIQITKSFISPWDGRKWNIRQHLTCKSRNIVYLIICSHNNHDNYAWYIGSCRNICERWRCHRNDFINKHVIKCGFSRHSEEQHPDIQLRVPIPFIKVILLESLRSGSTEQHLVNREVWWQVNVGTIFFGLNKRKDFNVTLDQTRINYGNN